ncbi:MAG: hypothetical protein ACK5MF_11625 [Vibrio sp.]|uniref:hypothetical protein n=1 Tax=Vibrio sp. TaxID=678 RepID=UPI003A8A50DD
MGFAILTGCASTSNEQSASNDARVCAQNFTQSGSLLTGKQYKTFEIIENAKQKSTFEKITRHITADGWHITNSDSQLGLLSASQTISFGEGKTAPLNITVEQINSDVKTAITFTTSAGVYSPATAVMNSFCEIIEAAK